MRRLRYERQEGSRMWGRQTAGPVMRRKQGDGGCVVSKEKTTQQRGKCTSGASFNVMAVKGEGRSR